MLSFVARRRRRRHPLQYEQLSIATAQHTAAAGNVVGISNVSFWKRSCFPSIFFAFSFSSLASLSPLTNNVTFCRIRLRCRRVPDQSVYLHLHLHIERDFFSLITRHSND